MKYLPFLILLPILLAIETDTNLLSRSLEEVGSLDTSSLDCSTTPQQFIQMNNELNAWADIVEHKSVLPKDIQTLSQIKQILQASLPSMQLQSGNHAPIYPLAASFAEIKHLSSILKKKLDNLRLPKTQSRIGAPQLAEINSQLSNLSSHDQETRKDCCEKLMKIVDYLMRQMQNMNNQCQSTPVTIVKIKGKVKDLQIVQQGCQTPQTP